MVLKAFRSWEALEATKKLPKASTLEAKFDSFHKIMTQISAAQQETSAAVEEFKKERAKAEALHKKESEARKARYQQAHLASAASMISISIDCRFLFTFLFEMRTRKTPTPKTENRVSSLGRTRTPSAVRVRAASVSALCTPSACTTCPRSKCESTSPAPLALS